VAGVTDGSKEPRPSPGDPRLGPDEGAPPHVGRGQSVSWSPNPSAFAAVGPWSFGEGRFAATSVGTRQAPLAGYPYSEVQVPATPLAS